MNKDRDLIIFLILIASPLLVILGQYLLVILTTPHGYTLFVEHLEPPKDYINLSDLKMFPEVAEALEKQCVDLNFSQFLELSRIFNGSEAVVKVNESYYKVYLHFHGVIKKLENAENYSHVNYDELPKVLQRIKFEVLDNVDVHPLIARNISEVIELKEFLDKYGYTIELNGNYYKICFIKYYICAKEIKMPMGDVNYAPYIKYTHVVLTHDDLKRIPILETAIKLANKKGHISTRITKEDFHKILELLNGCSYGYAEYNGEYYKIHVYEFCG